MKFRPLLMDEMIKCEIYFTFHEYFITSLPQQGQQ